MHLFRLSEKPLTQAPRLSWQPYKHGAKSTVAVICPACGRAMSLPHHRIDLDGFVVGAVACPYAGRGECTLKAGVFVLLEWVKFWSAKPN